MFELQNVPALINEPNSVEDYIKETERLYQKIMSKIKLPMSLLRFGSENTKINNKTWIIVQK